MSDEERKKLNLKAGRLIQSLGISDTREMEIIENSFDLIREYGFVGYAHYYLKHCWDDSELKNEADVTAYKKLLDIDSKLGTTQSEQLFKCVRYSPRKDLIQV